MSQTEVKETLDVPRVASQPRTFSQEYWDRTRERRLVVQYDTAVGQYQFFPRATSIYSGRRRNIEWREVSGKGAVFSFTVARRCRPPFRGYEPFFIVVITLDEGVNVMANMVNVGLEKMHVGLRVRSYWHPLPDGTHLLMFEPDE